MTLHCATCRCEIPWESPTDEERALIVAGRVLDAIKTVRYRSGLGLREAKALVDRWRAMPAVRAEGPRP